MRLVIAGFALVAASGGTLLAKDAADYPLRVSIAETRSDKGHFSVSGSGRGNVHTGDMARGFDYVYSCGHPFNATQGTALYPAKWKKEDSRIAILTPRIGDPKKQDECELKVTMVDAVYGVSGDGHAITYSRDQWNKAVLDRHMLAEHNHPTDTDPAHYPLLVTILDVQWQDNPLSGGVIGTGRGNMHNGAGTIAYDFAALCPVRFNISPAGQAYQARLMDAETRLLVLSHTPGDPDRTCVFKTESHSTQVYLRNNVTGVVSAVSREEFKQRTAGASPLSPTGTPAAAKAVSLARLTNSDVIAMTRARMSTEIIVAKMNGADCDFDTSPGSLRQLKAAHVPDAIVVEMIKRSSK